MFYHPKLTTQHFLIVSEWKIHLEKKNYYMDCSTNELYIKDPLWLIRFKAVLLLLVSPISQSLTILYKMFYLVCKIMTLSAFFSSTNAQFDWIQKCDIFLLDFLHLVIMPLSIVILDLALLYALISPLDGRKLYSNLFILFYQDTIIPGSSYFTLPCAPCFRAQKKLKTNFCTVEGAESTSKQKNIEWSPLLNNGIVSVRTLFDGPSRKSAVI